MENDGSKEDLSKQDNEDSHSVPIKEEEEEKKEDTPHTTSIQPPEKIKKKRGRKPKSYYLQ